LTRRDDSDRYYETPVHRPSSPTRYDPNRRPANLQQVTRAQNVHPNDRGRLVSQGGVNDPGATRLVSTANPHGGGNVSHTGVMYHPEGNSRGYERAPLGDRDRRSREEEHQYYDYRGGNSGGTYGGGQSWPPRGARSDDLTRREESYSGGRRGGSGGGGRSGGSRH
jgi:hypothetical protein